MRRFFLAVVTILAVTAWASAASAQSGRPYAYGNSPYYHRPMPIRQASPPERQSESRPAAPAPAIPPVTEPAPGRQRDSGPHGHARHHGGAYHYGYAYPYRYGYPYPLDPYWNGGWSFDPYWGPPPPLFLPAETLYGPEAVKRFMGADQVAPPSGGYGVDLGRARAVPQPARATSPQARQLAERFIEFGDNHFQAQRYASALSRYKKAAEAAPGEADALFRQGFALAALGRYDLAANALRRGLAINPDWPDAGFRIHRLYGGDRVAKQAHLDSLAQEATDHPDEADLLFLVGVVLHCDGQPGRAKPFLERALQLTDEPAAVRAFLE